MSYKNMAILTDVTTCIGCEKCVAACQKENKLPPERPWPWMKNIRDLSSARWTTIRRIQHPEEDRFLRRQCRHCLEPACVEACIVGALQKTPEGPVIYDPDICIGCRYCMIVCPWEIPRYSWENPVPYIQKCNLCYERVLKQGKIPACVEACTAKSTIFGERDDLLKIAHQRIEQAPQTYINHVWGEHEVGGTSVLYISDVPLNLSDVPIPIRDELSVPHRTFKVLHHMPKVFVGMAAAMGGIHVIIRRRQELERSQEPPSGDSRSDVSDAPSESRPNESTGNESGKDEQ